jgi:hypothetical protein
MLLEPSAPLDAREAAECQRDEGNRLTKRELYERARRRHIAGRSKMRKDALRKALGIG